MELKTFRRGVHPHDGKELSNKAAIKTLNPEPGELVTIPMSQHIGAPCEPIVKPGERVLVGQKIGEAKAFVSSPVHASVSGTVKFVKPVLTPGGAMVNSVIIENDGEFEEAPEQIDAEKAIDKIKAAGIVGMGGAGFPTHVKLSPGPDSKITDIIVNAAECEPYLTCDHRCMVERGGELVDGLKIMLKLFPGAKGHIGIEANKPDAIAEMEKLTKDDSDISVVALKCKYPQGSEKQLISAITGREVPSGALPAAVGCIVDNVATVMAIRAAVSDGKALTRRVVTVTGDAVVSPSNFDVPLGMTYAKLIEAAGGFKEDPAKVISGGPMMGIALHDTEVPVTKTTSGILCLTKKAAEIPPESNCIRCGKCVEHCPMGLMPLYLNSDTLAGDDDAFIAHHGIDCIECGSCSFICPAKRQLAQSIRVNKRAVMAKLRAKGGK